ncbi:MAG: GNAT family N-acetyltransferase [Bradymonadaceae bacterium]
MEWTIERTDDIEAFDAAVRDYLMEHEAIHNVALGVLDTLESGVNPYTGDNLLAYARSAGEIGGVIMRTPPYPGLLSLVADEAAAARLVDTLIETYSTLEEFNVPKDVAAAALARFEERGYDWEIGMRQRLYRTSTVDAPEDVSGSWRRAEAADREQLIEWLVRFEMEANDEVEEAARQKTAEQVETFVNEGLVFLWTVDGEPVSMAGYVGHTPHGVRVGYVYTPPAHREHGYASDVTAVATRQALEAGYDYCYLFTDLDNETTNRIYPALGYEPVADQHNYELTSPVESEGSESEG